MPSALDVLAGQPRVYTFLSRAVAERRVSHAYLFVGAPGAGMDKAADALAKCLVCPSGGDGSCGECIRVSHRTHPDVTWLSPGSVTGYLVGQIRELIESASLTPVRAQNKVYILERAETLRGAAANALLKTLEEPPSAVTFILIARSADSVLSTIASRCQQVPFRTLSEGSSLSALESLSGVSGERAKIALSVAGTPEDAARLLDSPDRLALRRLVVRTISELANDDSWDVLLAAREIVEAAKAPLAEYKAAQEALAEQNADYLTPKAMKEMADASKRELTARERSSMMEALAAADSVLRDVLLVCEGLQEEIVNGDVRDAVVRIASSTCTKGALDALAATRAAADDLARNVNAQLAFEVMLLGIKEALSCPPSSR